MILTALQILAEIIVMETLRRIYSNFTSVMLILIRPTSVPQILHYQYHIQRIVLVDVIQRPVIAILVQFVLLAQHGKGLVPVAAEVVTLMPEKHIFKHVIPAAVVGLIREADAIRIVQVLAPVKPVAIPANTMNVVPRGKVSILRKVPGQTAAVIAGIPGLVIKPIPDVMTRIINAAGLHVLRRPVGVQIPVHPMPNVVVAEVVLNHGERAGAAITTAAGQAAIPVRVRT